MEITRIASERNDEGDCRLDCCVGYVKLFLLDRWRCRAVDGTLRRTGLHRLLGPLCFHKQSSKGKKKIFLNSVGVVSKHCVITFSQFYITSIWVICCVYALFAFFLYEDCYEDTLYYKTFLKTLLFWPFKRNIRLNIPLNFFPSLLLLSSEILFTTFSQPTCSSLNKPFSPGTLPPLMTSERV